MGSSLGSRGNPFSYDPLFWEKSQGSKLQKLKSNEEKDWKKWNRISKNCGTPTKGVTYLERRYRKKEEKIADEIFEAIMSVNFPKSMSDTKPAI